MHRPIEPLIVFPVYQFNDGIPEIKMRKKDLSFREGSSFHDISDVPFTTHRIILIYVELILKHTMYVHHLIKIRSLIRS